MFLQVMVAKDSPRNQLRLCVFLSCLGGNDDSSGPSENSMEESLCPGATATELSLMGNNSENWPGWHIQKWSWHHTTPPLFLEESNMVFPMVFLTKVFFTTSCFPLDLEFLWQSLFHLAELQCEISEEILQVVRFRPRCPNQTLNMLPLMAQTFDRWSKMIACSNYSTM